jgi:hypothetical protein
MTFSAFTAYFTANRKHVPAALANDVRRAALSRLQERMQAGRADSALDFSDLIERMETSIASR